MSDSVLALNLGSSSLKFLLADVQTAASVLRGSIDGIGNRATLHLSGPAAASFGTFRQPAPHATAADALEFLFDLLDRLSPPRHLRAIGHRIVHGGLRHADPVRLDAEATAYLHTLVPMAPDHQAQALAAVEAAQARWPQLPQVGCFDTAFHRTHSPLVQRYALPRALTDTGIVRYGFHGLSYSYIADTLRSVAPECFDRKVVVAHLGHGASLCALSAGRSVATTMGFSVLDGLMMGQRCGSLDAGVVLYLLRELGWSVERVGDLLHHRSGLLGVSGLSDDVRDLEASDRPEAREALEMFAYRAALGIAEMAAALQGIDALVFCGGIGERDAAMRRRIGGYCAWLGVSLDDAANSVHALRIGSAHSPVAVLVVPTDEEVMIARAAASLTVDRSAA